MEIMDERHLDRYDWNLKREEVLSRFPEQFKELLYKGNASAHHILECLMRDRSAEEFITHLLEVQEKSLKRFQFVAERSSPQVMMALNEEIKNGKL